MHQANVRINNKNTVFLAISVKTREKNEPKILHNCILLRNSRNKFFSPLYILTLISLRESALRSIFSLLWIMKNHLIYQLESKKLITCNTEAFVNYKIRTLKQLVSIRQFSAFRGSTELTRI